MSDNVGASASWNPKALRGLYRDNFTFTIYLISPSETARNRTLYIYTFLLRVTDTMTSQNIDLFSWDTLHTPDYWASHLRNSFQSPRRGPQSSFRVFPVRNNLVVWCFLTLALEELFLLNFVCDIIAMVLRDIMVNQCADRSQHPPDTGVTNSTVGRFPAFEHSVIKGRKS
jgi:hypothetical protein